MSALRVGFLGPAGTFTEQALLTQPDLARAQLVPIRSIPDVLAATGLGRGRLGFVPIENAIEGSVNVTLDTLAFETDLLIEREVVIPINLCLIARARRRRSTTSRSSCRSPTPSRSAAGSCNEQLPGVITQAANSTADAVAPAGRATATAARPRSARPAPPRSTASRCWPTSIEDHPENATRFVVVAPDGHPGADRPRQDVDRRVPAGRRPRLAARRSCRSSRPGPST